MIQRTLGHKQKLKTIMSENQRKKPPSTTALPRLPHQPFAFAVDVDAAAVLHPSDELSVVHLLQDGAGADRQPPPAVDLVLEKLAVVHVAVDVPVFVDVRAGHATS